MTLPETDNDPKSIADMLGAEFVNRANAHTLVFNAYTFSRFFPYLIFPDHVFYDELNDTCYTDSLGEPKEIDDAGINDLRIFMQGKYTDLLANYKGKSDWDDKEFCAGVLSAAMRDSRNSFRDYVESVKWDGKPRIATIFQDFLGATDNAEYLSTVAQTWLLGAVIRQYETIRHEIIPAFIGTQGLGKTSFFNLLGGKYYGSTQMGMDKPKEFRESIKGCVIVELGEGKSIRKDINATKEFLSKDLDRYRDTYGRNGRLHPRRFIVGITSNNREFINDQTGARRFYPIHCTDQRKFDPRKEATPEMKEYIDQIWAEALTLYRAGKKSIIPADVAEKFIPIQNSVIEHNENVDKINEWLDTALPHVGDQTCRRMIEDLVFGLEGNKAITPDISRALNDWSNSADTNIYWKYVSCSKTHKTYPKEYQYVCKAYYERIKVSPYSDIPDDKTDS